jgi:glucuronoarabinoxylan endo-1,4-beta-xylanase
MLKNMRKLFWVAMFCTIAATLAFNNIIPVNAAGEATVNLTATQQVIRGFGGINYPGWINDLTSDQVDKAFGNGAGQIGMSILRIHVPYNSSDWSKEIPTAVRAKSLGAIIFASPWTPPASMKTNNNTTGGSLNTSSYAAYAAHLKSFCDYMSTNGVPLYAISIQNEPDIQVSYDSCDWTSTQMVNFLKNNASAIGSTRIIAAESFNFNHSFTDPILNDATAASKVSIIGGHIYGAGLADYPLARQKGKEIWMTEHFISGDGDWSSALSTAKEISDCMKANFNAYIWWYIRRSYGPIDESGNVTKKGYVMSQFAKFARPGYYRVDVAGSQSNVDVTAYKGDNVVIVAINRNSSAVSQTFVISGGSVASVTPYVTSSSQNMQSQAAITVSGGSFTATLPAQSITTFVSNGQTPATPTPALTPTPARTPTPVRTATPVSVTPTPVRVTSSPLVTPTPAQPTASPVVTTTPPVGSGSIKIQFYNQSTATTTNQIYTNIKLINTGTSAVTLSNVKIRYYYTVDGAKTQNFYCDYSPIGSSNITGTFVTMSTAKTGADTYLEAGFTSGAGSLAAGGNITIQSRFAKTDWSNYTQSNDYSFNSTATSYGDWTKVTGYVSGALQWGTEP